MTALAINLTHLDPVKREIFQNKDFRIGLSHAINRQEIVDIVYLGQGVNPDRSPRNLIRRFMMRNSQINTLSTVSTSQMSIWTRQDMPNEMTRVSVWVRTATESA